MNLYTKNPLAERMRPLSYKTFVGHEKLIGEKGILRNVLQIGNIPSMILWGPPGVGKTTLAHIIAHTVKKPFHMLKATEGGVKDFRKTIEQARRAGECILFVDEIHRFNKLQQDGLLEAVEKGLVTLIGATTENPSFEINAALLSRCQVYSLNSLSNANLLWLLNQALQNDKLLKRRTVVVKETNALLTLSSGDARKLFNIVELISEVVPGDIIITDALVEDIAQRRVPRYDKNGSQHYTIISAFIKSVRGSDPNAAVYYLARMIEGGEDPLFIARRLVILASEDIGNANPNALVIATSTFQAASVIGYPEAEIILSHCTSYLASSPKSNASYLAIKKAKKKIAETGDLSIPMRLRNAPTRLMKNRDYGKGYQYAHDYKDHFIDMEFMPDELKGTVFYSPGDNPREREIRMHLKKLWQTKYHY